MSTGPFHLDLASRALCDDALVAACATGRFETEALGALARRRETATTAALRGAPIGPESGDAWLLPFCTALAPISPPQSMPLADLVEGGLSLEHGARGLRSLFTSKPSDKEIARIRALGQLAVRAVLAVHIASSGKASAEAGQLVDMLIASIGIPIEEREALRADAARGVEALPLTGDVERDYARGLVRGCFAAAMGDGIDAAEETAILAVGRKCGLTGDEVTSLRAEAQQRVDALRAVGLAAVDGVRFMSHVASGQPGGPTVDPIARMVATLTLPIIHRGPAMQAIDVAQPVVLSRKHGVARRERRAILAAGWLAVLRHNPSRTDCAVAAARHDALAIDLGDLDDGTATRRAVDELLERELGVLVRAHGR